MKNTVHR